MLNHWIGQKLLQTEGLGGRKAGRHFCSYTEGVMVPNKLNQINPNKKKQEAGSIEHGEARCELSTLIYTLNSGLPEQTQQQINIKF